MAMQFCISLRQRVNSNKCPRDRQLSLEYFLKSEFQWATKYVNWGSDSLLCSFFVIDFLSLATEISR